MDLSILLIAIVTAIACSVLGVFLVLRKMSMMIDAISHTVLLGIVIAFMFVHDLSSPLLIIGATLMGLVTVFLIEFLVKTKRTTEDAATGVIFPLLFSIAVLIISTSFRNVHLDIDAVLLGKLELASFDQLVIGGVEIGPKLLYTMLVMMFVNLVAIKIFYKELKLVSFDGALAATLGFAPFIIHYLLMALVSLTAVSAFNAVGTILVVALMVGPAVTALLITKDLKYTLFYAAIIGVINSVLGYFLALAIDTNISGMIATTTLGVFILVLVFSPQKGILTTQIKRARLKNEFKFLTFIFHIGNHQHTEDQDIELSVEHINQVLKWTTTTIEQQIHKGIDLGLITYQNKIVLLTKLGMEYHDFKYNEISREV